MNKKEINPNTISLPVGNYSHAIEISNHSRLLYISGQIPEDVDDLTPLDFDTQCELIWSNIGEILKTAGLGYENIIKVNTYLTHADQTGRNGEIRRKYLGNLKPALTVVVVQTLESKWLLEIEAVAAA